MPRTLKYDKSAFGCDPVFEGKDGWYFWDETGADCLGPFRSEWEAEKILSMYCFDEQAIGDNRLLYLDPMLCVFLAAAIQGD